MLLRTPKQPEKAKQATDKLEDVLELIQERRGAGSSEACPDGYD